MTILIYTLLNTPIFYDIVCFYIYFIAFPFLYRLQSLKFLFFYYIVLSSFFLRVIPLTSLTVIEPHRRGLHRRAPCSRVHLAYSLCQLRVGILPLILVPDDQLIISCLHYILIIFCYYRLVHGLENCQSHTLICMWSLYKLMYHTIFLATN